MDPTTIALLTIGICVVLILLEMPVALAIGLSGTIGTVLLTDPQTAAATLGTAPYSATAKYALFAVPTYVLLGCLISNAGIGTQIYRVVNRFTHKLPGGLAATAVVATSIFSGISGSSAADVATFGRISVTEMTRNGYRRHYAAAVVAAAGTFAALIPPSITLVIYAIVAEVSIGAMILAGVVPGVLSAMVLSAFVIGRTALANQRQTNSPARTTPDREALRVGGGSGSADPVEVPSAPVPAVREKTTRSDGLAIVYAAILFGVVIGGLYAGIFTATEAGAMGAFAAFLIAWASKRQTGKSIRKIVSESVVEGAEISSMIFLLLVGGAIFSYTIALSGLPTDLAQWAGQLDVPPKLVLAIILLTLIPLGAFLDGLSVILLTVPVIAPIALDLGFDGVWFGILVLKMIEIGLITPPVGINAFIISGITHTPVEKVYKALVPFVLLDLGVTAVFFFVPDLILWLPRLAGLS